MKNELGMSNYLTNTRTTLAGRKLGEWIKELILNDKSVPYYMDKIKESSDKRLANNPFIQNISVEVDPRTGQPSSIKIKQKDYDTYTSNVLSDSLRNLRNDGTVIEGKKVSDIYKNLVMYSVLKSGVDRTPTSFNHLIPAEDYSPLVSGALGNVDESIRAFYDNNVLYRTNWNDDTLVPRVARTGYMNEQTGDMSFLYPFVRSKKILQGFAEGEKPKILKLDHFQYNTLKAVKTVDFEKDAKGKITGKKVSLFKRLDAEEGVPFMSITKRIDPEDPVKQDGSAKYIEETHAYFVEINKWGSPDKVNEFYDDRVESELADNQKIKEYDDDRIMQAFIDGGVTTNLEKSVSADPEKEDLEDSTPVTSEPTKAPSEPMKPINFKDIEMEEVKRAGKKGTFNISQEGEVGEIEGYHVNIPSHPGMDLYVTKEEDGSWAVIDNNTTKRVVSGDSTAKGAIERAINNINEAIKNGKHDETLKKIGVEELKECNPTFTVKPKE